MDRLNAMRLYVAVVDARSFAHTARVLGQPRSTVSRVVKELEAWLGAQLLQRITRKLGVTAGGRQCYKKCKRLLTEMAAMGASFPGHSAQPTGQLRAGMPQSLAHHYTLPRVGEFLQQYPDLKLILCSSDSVRGIIRERFDRVIRTGRIEDSTTLVAHPLIHYRWMVLASPARLAAHSRPQSIDDLHQRRAVGYLNHRTGRAIDWFFSLDDGDCAIRMQEALMVNDTDAYIQAGIQELDLIRVTSYPTQPYLQSGALVARLGQVASNLPLSPVHPQSRYLPPVVRAFYDWSRHVLQPPLSEA